MMSSEILRQFFPLMPEATVKEKKEADIDHLFKAIRPYFIYEVTNFNSGFIVLRYQILPEAQNVNIITGKGIEKPGHFAERRLEHHCKDTPGFKVFVHFFYQGKPPSVIDIIQHMRAENEVVAPLTKIH